MRNTQKKSIESFIFENDNIRVRLLFANWKIWLTKNEIVSIYWIEKNKLTKEINKILINSHLDIWDNVKKVYNKKKDKNETFYSLDVLLLLGYKSKHFKETKFLVNTNKVIKEYALSRKHRLTSLSWIPIMKNILNYFKPALTIV